ncbi:polysaccharide biosynthesis C-terminal domain-containing protein [bacterium]|nr:polysaccharide biosynthesis C-terminal domain-containing protein [bacterium]
MVIDDIKSSFKNYAFVVLGTILKALVGFGCLLIITHILSPADYGRLNLFLMVTSLGSILLGWTQSAVVRFGKEEMLERRGFQKTFSSIFLLFLINLSVALALFLAFRGKVTSYVGFTSSGLSVILLFPLYCFFSSANQILLRFFQTDSKFLFYSFLPPASRLIQLMLLALLSSGLIRGELTSILWIITVAEIAIFPVPFLFYIGRFLPFKFSPSWTKEILIFAVPLFISSISGYILNFIDIFVINNFLPKDMVGYYSLYYKLFEYLALIPSLTISITYPIYTTLHLEKKDKLLKQYIEKINPVFGFAWSVALGVVLMFHREILSIFGREFTTGGITFAILVFVVAPRIIWYPVSPIFSTHKLTKQAMYATVSMSIANIILDLLLVPCLGITGAAVATGISFLLATSICVWLIKKHTGISVWNGYPQILPALLVLLVVISVDSLPVRIILSALLLALSYIVAKREGIFSEDTRYILEKIDIPAPVKNLLLRFF